MRIKVGRNYSELTVWGETTYVRETWQQIAHDRCREWVAGTLYLLKSQQNGKQKEVRKLGTSYKFSDSPTVTHFSSEVSPLHRCAISQNSTIPWTRCSNTGCCWGCCTSNFNRILQQWLVCTKQQVLISSATFVDLKCFWLSKPQKCASFLEFCPSHWQ